MPAEIPIPICRLNGCRFSSGLELANLVVNSELLHRSWDAISDLEKRSCTHVPDLPLSVEYKECEHPGMGTIVAFACPSSVNVQQLERVGTDLVSADEIAGFFSMFDFVRTKVNPSFSVHKAAASLFSSHMHLLSLLKEKVNFFFYASHIHVLKITAKLGRILYCQLNGVGIYPSISVLFSTIS